MKVRVKINKLVALMAGQDLHGMVVVEVPAAELTPTERETLSHFADNPLPDEMRWTADFFLDGHKTLVVYREAFKDFITPSPATLRHILREIARIDAVKAAEKEAKEKEEAAKRESVIQELLTSPVEDLIGHGSCWFVGADVRLVADDERVAGKIAEAQKLCRQRNAAVEEEARKAEEDALAKIAEAGERLQRQVAAWVREYGTENQQIRHEEGLLPLDEVKQGMRYLAFAPAEGVILPFERLTDADVCRCAPRGKRDHGTCDIKYSVVDANDLDEEQIEVLTKLREMFPTSTIVARCHRGVASGLCGRVVRRYSALVTIPVGEFTFSREYEYEFGSVGDTIAPTG